MPVLAGRKAHHEKVPAPEVVTTLKASEIPLPPQIQEALGELVGAARQGLLALSVGVGLGVAHELMELRALIKAYRPELLAETGCGALAAAIFIGRTAGAERFKRTRTSPATPASPRSPAPPIKPSATAYTAAATDSSTTPCTSSPSPAHAATRDQAVSRAQARWERRSDLTPLRRLEVAPPCSTVG